MNLFALNNLSSSNEISRRKLVFIGPFKITLDKHPHSEPKADVLAYRSCYSEIMIRNPND